MTIHFANGSLVFGAILEMVFFLRFTLSAWKRKCELSTYLLSTFVDEHSSTLQKSRSVVNRFEYLIDVPGKAKAVTRSHTWIQRSLEKAARVLVRVGWASFDWRSGCESMAVARNPWSQAKSAFTWMYSTGLIMPFLRPDEAEWILATQSRYLTNSKSYSAVTSLSFDWGAPNFFLEKKTHLTRYFPRKSFYRGLWAPCLSNNWFIRTTKNAPFRNLVCSESSLRSLRESTTPPS